ncbi:MAG TPA: hypothetical protein VGR37_09030 [Longimicrobiaceae bacterium]|nr:hypothetical protein [Longimicrobiaceae bacterium]
MRKERELEPGRQAWEAYHAAVEEERRAAEQERHHAILRGVHRNNPDFLRGLGIEPLPDQDIVAYPPEEV